MSYITCEWASLVAQMLKNLPAIQETWVQSLGREDPQEKEMATHSSIRTWRIPWTEEPRGLQPVGSQRVGHDRAANTHTHTHTPVNVIRRMKGYWVYWGQESENHWCQGINKGSRGRR